MVLVDGNERWAWLREAAHRRLLEGLAKLDVSVNAEKTRHVDLTQVDATFAFLGFDFRRVLSQRNRWMPLYMPRAEARAKLLARLREVFRKRRSQPTSLLIAELNPIIRGWVNHFRIGHASRCFSYVRDWVAKKVRRHLMRAKGRRGHGRKRWSRAWLYPVLGLCGDYAIRYYHGPKARSAGTAS